MQGEWYSDEHKKAVLPTEEEMEHRPHIIPTRPQGQRTDMIVMDEAEYYSPPRANRETRRACAKAGHTPKRYPNDKMFCWECGEAL